MSYSVGDMFYAETTTSLALLHITGVGKILGIVAGKPAWIDPIYPTISGVSGRTVVTGTASNPIVDVSASYIGQSTITTLGSVTTGTWNANVISTSKGGTGLSSIGTNGQYLGVVGSSLGYITPPSTPAIVDSSVSRTLNSIFQVSTTRNCLAYYSVDLSTVFSLAGGQVGIVYFETSPSATFASSITVRQRFSNGNSGAIVVGLTLNQIATACLSGMIPAGHYARLRTENNTGSPTFTFRSGQEVLI